MPNSSLVGRAGRYRHRLIAVGIVLTGVSFVTLQARAPIVTLRGVVAGVTFTPPVGSTPPSSGPAYYSGAKVCADLNDNAICDPSEPATFTDTSGRFTLRTSPAPLVADITINSASAQTVGAQHVTFRSAFDAVAEGDTGAGPLGIFVVNVSPL